MLVFVFFLVIVFFESHYFDTYLSICVFSFFTFSLIFLIKHFYTAKSLDQGLPKFHAITDLFMPKYSLKNMVTENCEFGVSK